MVMWGVDALSVYEEVMVTPRAGFGVCRECFNLTRGFELCYACAQLERTLDAIIPISYSVAAGAVQAPLRDDDAGTFSTMAISMSVAVNVRLPSRTAIMTFARMGMVFRRSTTLWTWASALNRPGFTGDSIT
jgi:hypothetical protein